MKSFAYSLFLLLACLPGATAAAQAAEHAVVFYEPGFPSPDSVQVSEAQLHAGFAGAGFTGAAQLPSALADADLLVLPFGSAYPEVDWKSILEYLDRGGNLLVLGGKPFTRGAYRDASGWHLRAPSVAASLELLIHDYQETPGSRTPGPRTPGSDGLKFEANRDVQPALPEFSWKRAFSPVLRLSVVQKYNRDGSTGDEDADLTTLAWGTRDGHKLAAPVFQIDHNQFRFVGGRWIFAACEPGERFFGNAPLLTALAQLATRRADRFT